MKVVWMCGTRAIYTFNQPIRLKESIFKPISANHKTRHKKMHAPSRVIIESENMKIITLKTQKHVMNKNNHQKV